ncbi:hypothetical protein ACEQ8H_006475 [Pleosporales sp. CAS-2024a]
MPPKARPNVLRGRGRSKRSDAPVALSPVASAPAQQRGRVAKPDVVEAAAESPKKRGRPAKATVQQGDTIAPTEAPKRSRRSLNAPRALENHAPAPKKPAGRPSKAVPAMENEAPPTSKRRGRPAKRTSAANLSRVAGSPRVTKARSNPIVKGTRTTTAPRMNPRMRSKLRTRLPPANKPIEHVVPAPTKRRGRPPKATALVQDSPPKKAAGRKATKVAVTKPTAPRKKRGHTILEIPDKFAAQVRRYLTELQDAASLPTPVNAGGKAGHVEEDGDVLLGEEADVTSPVAAADAQDDVALASEEVLEPQEINVDEATNYVDGDMQYDTTKEVVIENIQQEAASNTDSPRVSQYSESQMEVTVDDVEDLALENHVSLEDQSNVLTSILDDDATSMLMHHVEPSPSAGAVFT